MKRAFVFLVSAALLAIVAVAALEYFSGPRRVAAKFLACHGAKDKSLTTADDQRYWDEAHRFSEEEPMRALVDACLGAATIEEVSVHGRSADVKFKVHQPDLTWEEATEFPATSTLAERVAIVRQRASHSKYSDAEGTLKLRLEGMGWRVLLNLKSAVLLAREVRKASDLEKAGDDAAAIAAYERLAAHSELDSAQRKSFDAKRLDVIAKKACRTAAKQYLKYPDSAEFDLTGLASLAKGGPISVIGSAISPNAFGVKGKSSISCDVTFSPDEPEAYVKLFMFPEHDPASLVSEARVVVKL